MTRRRLLIAGWLLVLGLSASLPLSALFHGIVHVGTGDMTVRAPLTRPVISVGSDVVLLHGSRSIVVTILGDIQLSGRARDDLVALDGRIYLAPGSKVDGDVLSLLGGIYKAPGVTAMGRLGGALHPWDGVPRHSRADFAAVLLSSIRLGLAAGLALLLVGTCLTVVFPWQVVLIASTLRSAPLKSAAAGIMNLVIFVFLVVPLGLSLAGLPFAILLTGAASLAWLFGLTASAVLMGRLLSRGTVSLIWASGAGLVIIAVSLAVPVLGPLAITAVGLTGAGALAVALMTRSRPAAPMP
jgi:hypothetical protein